MQTFPSIEIKSKRHAHGTYKIRLPSNRIKVKVNLGGPYLIGAGKFQIWGTAREHRFNELILRELPIGKVPWRKRVSL